MEVVKVKDLMVLEEEAFPPLISSRASLSYGKSPLSHSEVSGYFVFESEYEYEYYSVSDVGLKTNKII